MFEKYRNQGSKFVEIPLPEGKEKLYIAENGQVLSLKKGPVSFGYDEQGNKAVRLDLWNGLKDYKVSLLSLVAFGKLRLQTTYYDSVEPFHIDGNKNNLNPSNLGYRYTRPIECETVSGFYYIPFFNNYVINREGEVRNWKTNRRLKSRIKVDHQPERNRKGGYIIHSLRADPGFTVIGLHRLLALTFLPYPDDVDKLAINHIDGNPSNNALENLEWCTHRHNLLHAMTTGLMSRTVSDETLRFEKGYAKNVISGEEIEFESFYEAEKKTGVTRPTVKERIVTGSQSLCVNGWLFKEDKSAPWRKVSNPWPELKALSSGMEVRSKNIFTGEVRTHSNLSATGRELGFDSVQGPRQQIFKGYRRPYCGYLFKMKYDKTPWPEYTARQLAVFRDNPKDPRTRGVIARKDDGEEIFFTNICKAAEHFRQTLKTKNDVIKAISRNRIVDGFSLYYFDPLTGATSDPRSRCSICPLDG